MLFWHDPRLERKTRRESGKRNKMPGLGHYALAGKDLLFQHVTKEASLFISIIHLGARELFLDPFKVDRRPDDLGPGVPDMSAAGRLAVVLEDEDFSKQDKDKQTELFAVVGMTLQNSPSPVQLFTE